MEARLHLDLEPEFRRIVREELARATAGTSPWMSAKSAWKYLDITEDALRGVVKRGELIPSRSSNGRLFFRREQLDAFASGGSVDT